MNNWKVLGLIALICIFALSVKFCCAEEVNLKQGMIVTWGDGEFKQLTAIEVAKTHPVESWGRWNALWDGWSVDVGYPWDNSSSRDAALVLGREFGTLGKYLPINFPFKDRLIFSIYVAGLYAKNLLDMEEVHIKGCSGGAYLKGTLKF